MHDFVCEHNKQNISSLWKRSRLPTNLDDGRSATPVTLYRLSTISNSWQVLRKCNSWIKMQWQSTRLGTVREDYSLLCWHSFFVPITGFSDRWLEWCWKLEQKFVEWTLKICSSLLLTCNLHWINYTVPVLHSEQSSIKGLYKQSCGQHSRCHTFFNQCWLASQEKFSFPKWLSFCLLKPSFCSFWQHSPFLPPPAHCLPKRPVERMHKRKWTSWSWVSCHLETQL